MRFLLLFVASDKKEAPGWMSCQALLIMQLHSKRKVVFHTIGSWGWHIFMACSIALAFGNKADVVDMEIKRTPRITRAAVFPNVHFNTAIAGYDATLGYALGNGSTEPVRTIKVSYQILLFALF